MKTKFPISPDYAAFVTDLKTRIRSARLSAARAVNRELILLYWDIGQGIVEKQQQHGWGDGIVEALAADLQNAFPGVSGFSARNLWDMRHFFSAYTDSGFLRQVVAELPTGGKRARPDRDQSFHWDYSLRREGQSGSRVCAEDQNEPLRCGGISTRGEAAEGTERQAADRATTE